MRKLFCLFMVLVLFPVVSFSDENDEGLFIGTWIHTEYLKDGTLQFIILDLHDDHSSVAVFGKADGDDSNVPGRSFIGTWSFNSDTVHVVTGHNTSKDLILTDNGFVGEKMLGGGYMIYSPVQKYDKNDASIGPVPLSMLETGVQIPTGTYIIGQDIPAGVYRFDMNKSAASVTYYNSASDVFSDSKFVLNTRSKTYARLTLSDGGKLIIENASIILSYAKSLFE